MGYAIEQRFRLIDFLLDSYGHVGPKELVDFFDIGSACATRDFRAYLKANPENMIFSQEDRRYHKTNCFVSAYK